MMLSKETSIMSTHFTPGQQAMLVAALQLRQQQLDRQLSEHQEGRSRADHARDVMEQDANDVPQRAMDREVDLALSDFDLQELGAVSRALKRVQDGHFGICTDCGTEIPFDRLKVEPQAERCVACETRHESASQSRRI
jgi:DnaK suppressor protein